MKAAPETHDLPASRGRLGQAHRRLPRLRAARVQLRAVEVARRQTRDQLHQRGAMLRREASHVHPLQLARHLGDVPWVRIAEARDADARQQIYVAIAVEIP